MRMALVTSTLLLAAGGWSAEAAEVSREVMLGARPAAVWEAVGPFCAISDWHPAIAACKEERIGETVHRRLTTHDGGQILEKLLAHDDAGMSYSYTIEESFLPVAGYRATIAVADAGGKARVTWKSSFSPKGASEEEAERVIGGIFEAGLEELRQRFGG
jgi:hypothetical protein